MPGQSRQRVVLSTTCLSRADYVASATDSDVLQRPIKEELKPHEVKNVFGYPRNLKQK